MKYSIGLSYPPTLADIEQFVHFFPLSIQNLIQTSLELKEDKLSIQLPSSFFKSIKFFLQNLSLNVPEVQSNPLLDAWIFADACDESLIEFRDVMQEESKKAEAFYLKSPATVTFAKQEAIEFPTFFKGKKSRNVVIGEAHGDLAALQFIISNINTIRENHGIVVVENLCDTAQDELDRCTANRALSPLARLLIPTLNIAGYKESSILKEKMFELLFENSIRVVAGETETSNAINAHHPKERIKVLNYVMIENVRKYKMRRGLTEKNPVIYLVGLSHALMNYGYPGIVEMTNALYYELTDIRKNKHLLSH